MREANEAKAMSDKALKETQQERWKAESAAARAEAERRSAQTEQQNRREAEEKARRAEGDAYGTKMTYKSLFIGQMVFCLAMAFFVAYGKRGVLSEMGKWFPSRWNDFKGLLMGFKNAFFGLVDVPITNWHLTAVWGYIFAIVVSIMVVVVLFFLFCWLKDKISDFWWNVKRQYMDGTFKMVISADIALVMLYVCLFFHDRLTKALPFNILSIWLILTLVWLFVWNGKEIIGGVKRGW